MDTKIYLLNVPLENDHKHTLYFTSKAEQQAFFESKKIKAYTNCTYQRKDSIIRVPDNYDNISPSVNYVMYQNPSFSNKWFYAFIKEVEYKNNESTWIHIETDVIQTWLFDYTLKPSFVEREHVDDDGIGYHTVPEGLEGGEYYCNKHTLAGYGSDGDEYVQNNFFYVVGVTKYQNSEGAWVNSEGALYTNLFSGIKYYGFKATTDGVEALKNFIKSYTEYIDAIVCLFTLPGQLLVFEDNGSLISGNLIKTSYINNDLIAFDETNLKVDITTKTLNGYTPRNNKLLTYPYRYLNVSNNSGVDVIYKYELFRRYNSTEFVQPQFRIDGCICVGGSIRMIPMNYNGAEKNDNEGINLGKYPVLNWTSDVYTNWLTQNSLNIGLNIASGVGQVVGGVAIAAASGGLATAVGGSSVVGGVTTITNTLAEIHQKSFTPPQSNGNINSGDIVTASGRNDFHFYDMSIKEEYAKIIDGYFDMFGYKVNMIKIPNKAHRSRYWYTKTIDVNIDGAIPNNDMQKIKDCYNNGITFWRNANEIQNYSLSNKIV